jgi:simple sugar transport system ATP-binding protein
MPPVVELRGICKRFAHLTALDGVSLSIAPGTVHGLLGENGAGKTTLMNVLYGLIDPDAGALLVEGRPARIRNPRDALRAGVGMVHQHFMLAGAMTVLDNVLLGDRRVAQFLHRADAASELKALSIRLGLPVDPFARISDLSVGQQQRVEILKALYRDVRVLILDEPTAVLTPAESDQLFAAVDRLRGEGKSIVFISHKLGEIKRICDELTVLRRGKVVFAGKAAGVSSGEISRHMIGRDVTPVRRVGDVAESDTGRAAQPRNTVELTSISTDPLREVSLEVRAGEIVGIAGVDGNGQQELAEVILGLRPIESGRILFDGKDVTSPGSVERKVPGIAHIPNDRKREGLVGSMSVAENIALQHSLSRAGIMPWRSIRRTADALIRQFDVRAGSADALVDTLSGGNQQKVILARELGISPPRLVVAMNPARGLDVAATRFVHERLLAVRAGGGAVLLISGELDELLAMCDRIGVLYNGRLTMSDFPRDGFAEIGRLMTGAGIPA